MVKWLQEEAAAAAKTFEAAAAGRDFPYDFRQQPLGSQSAEDFLLDNVAAADLVIAAQCPPERARYS